MLQHLRRALKTYGVLAACYLSLAGTASAQPCGYLVYTPKALLQRILDAAPSAGLATLPAGLSVKGGPLDQNSVYLARGEALVAQLKFTENPLLQDSALHVFDMAGNDIFDATEEIHSCATLPGSGRCRSLRINDTRDGQVGGMPYLVRLSDLWDVDYYMYGEPAYPSTFSLSLNETFTWLMHYLKVTSAATPVLLATPLDHLRFMLATTPETATFYANLTFTQANGIIFIGGVVPSTPAHDLVVNAILQAGIVNFRDNIIIDTALSIAPESPRLYQCQVYPPAPAYPGDYPATPEPQVP